MLLKINQNWTRLIHNAYEDNHDILG